MITVSNRRPEHPHQSKVETFVVGTALTRLFSTSIGVQIILDAMTGLIHTDNTSMKYNYHVKAG